MTSVLLAVLVLLLAALTLYAGEKGVRYVFAPAKVATTLSLLALALSLGALDRAGGLALVAALVLSAVGDAALLRPDERSFTAGLGAFLLAHVAYLFAFTPSWLSLPGTVVAAALVAPFVLRSFPRVLRALDGDGKLSWAVTTYGGVLVAMAVGAGATGRPLVLLGGFSFVLSDLVLALDRFVAPRERSHIVVLGSYYLAQVLLVVGLLA